MNMVEFLDQLQKRPEAERSVYYVYSDGELTNLKVVSNSPASQEAIAKLNKLSRHSLTSAYENFLNKYNGVSFQFEDGYQHFEILSAENALESQQELTDGLVSGEPELLPFASIMGEYIFLDLTRTDQNVFWASGGEELSYIQMDFEGFLEKILEMNFNQFWRSIPLPLYRTWEDRELRLNDEFKEISN